MLDFNGVLSSLNFFSLDEATDFRTTGSLSLTGCLHSLAEIKQETERIQCNKFEKNF